MSSDKAADESHRNLLVGAKVRGIINCVECLKPRCIYSATRLLPEEGNEVERLKDEGVYTCGSELLPPDHHLASTVVARMNINCESPIETTYYGSSNAHFPEICFYCGERDSEQLLEDEYIQELKAAYAIVCPLCKGCRSAGKEAKVRQPNNVQCAKRRRLK